MKAGDIIEVDPVKMEQELNLLRYRGPWRGEIF